MVESVQDQLFALVSRSIEEKLDIDAFYAKLQPMAAAPEAFMAALAETFWLLWIKTDGPGGGERRMRLVELMRNCVRDKKLDRKCAMEVLEPDCMQAAGLVQDTEQWRKKEIRYNTRTSYTVQKYNLLREDSEGFSKLIVALNHFGDAALAPEMVQPLYREIQALIGYFDLDPNRVLDLVLDAAEAQPHNTAYLQLVPLFKKDAVVHLLGFKFQHYQDDGVKPCWPNLPLVAAQLIKAGLVELDALLGHLAPSDENIQKAQDQTNAELKSAVDNIGSVNLNAPSSAAPSNPLTENRALPTGYMDGPRMGMGPMGMGPPGMMGMRNPNVPGGGMGAPYGMGGGMAASSSMPNLGGMAADDSAASAAGGFRGLRSDKMELDPAAKYEKMLLPANVNDNQKLALADALLQVSAWEQANSLIARLAALGVHAAAWPPLSNTLSAIIAEELQPITDKLVPRGFSAPGLLDTLQATLAKTGQAAGSDAVRAALPSSYQIGPRISQRAFDALLALGPFLSRSPKLLAKAIQAMRHHYLLYCMPCTTTTTSNGNEAPAVPPELVAEGAKVEEVISRALLPACCLVPCNPAMSLEIWNLLKLLPFGTRYRIYSELKELIDKQPYLAAASKMAVIETRRVLKRIHAAPDKRDKKDVTKPYGRMLAKIAAANPIPVLEVAVQQVEAYLNQMEPIVEALRYLTPLGYDMLTYVMLSRLAMDRDKVKEDGINISDWLQSLAKFAGAVCRKYPEVDIFAVCQFLANALRGGESLDLLVLKEIVETLTGIAIESDLSTEQLEGKLGGDALASLVMMRDTDKSKKAWARGAKRLLDALQRGPPRSHLALPLLILVAQQRQAIMIHTEAQHIKFVVELYDKCHETCQQYIEFLQAALTFDDYVKLLPPLGDMRNTYKLEPEITLMAHRPLLRKLLDDLAAAYPPTEEGEIEEAQDGTETGEMTSTGDATMTPADGTNNNNNSTGSGVGNNGNRSELEVQRAAAKAAWQQALDHIRNNTLDQAMWNTLTPDMYALFWTLTVHDIYVPTKFYEVEMEKARTELRSIESQLSSARAAGGPAGMMGGGAGMGMMSMMMASAEEEEYRLQELSRQRDRLKDLLKRMPSELEAQTSRVTTITQHISRFMNELLVPVQNKKNMAATLVQECILPRVLSSPQDASFCAKFAELMHSMSVPFFSTVWYYNQLLKDVIPALRCVTDREAINMGIFLLETLRLLNHWRSSDKVYEEECISKPGFSISLAEPSVKRTTYDQYKRLMGKWHGIVTTTIKACLISNEYTSRRNALTILNRILPVFPVADKNVKELKECIEKVRVEEDREDLKVLLKSYSAALNVELDKPGRVIPQESFGMHGATAKPKRPGPAMGAAGARTNAAASPNNKRPAPTTSQASASTAATAATTATAEMPASKPARVPITARIKTEDMDVKNAAAPNEGRSMQQQLAEAAPQQEEARSHKRMKTEADQEAQQGTAKNDTINAPSTTATSHARTSLKREHPPPNTADTPPPAATTASAPPPATHKRPRIEPPAERVRDKEDQGTTNGTGHSREHRETIQDSRDDRRERDKEREREKGSGAGSREERKDRDKDRDKERESVKEGKDKEDKEKDKERESERKGRRDKRDRDRSKERQHREERRSSREPKDEGPDDPLGASEPVVAPRKDTRDRDQERGADRRDDHDRNRGGAADNTGALPTSSGGSSKRRHRDKDSVPSEKHVPETSSRRQDEEKMGRRTTQEGQEGSRPSRTTSASHEAIQPPTRSSSISNINGSNRTSGRMGSARR